VKHGPRRYSGILKLFGSVTELPLNGGTRTPWNTEITHCPTGVPANGAETVTAFTGPSGENVTLALPEPLGPSARLQAEAREAAEPSAESAAPRLSGERSPSGITAGGGAGGGGGGSTATGAGSAGSSGGGAGGVASFVGARPRVAVVTALRPLRAVLIASPSGAEGRARPAVGKLLTSTPTGPFEASPWTPALAVAWPAWLSWVVMSGVGPVR